MIDERFANPEFAGSWNDKDCGKPRAWLGGTRESVVVDERCKAKQLICLVDSSKDFDKATGVSAADVEHVEVGLSRIFGEVELPCNSRHLCCLLMEMWNVFDMGDGKCGEL